MRRRDFFGIVALPLTPVAQQSEVVRRVGLLPTGYRETDPEGQSRVDAFVERLGHLGWSNGRNIQIDIRWPSNDIDRIKAEAIALAESGSDLFMVSSNAALAALQKLDRGKPIVFVQVSDPLGSGFVSSLAHPDGNITGFQNFEPAVAGKWLGLLKEVAPALKRAGVPVYADTAAHRQFLGAAQAAAPSLGLEILAIDVREPDDLEHGIAQFAATGTGGLVFLPHPGSIDRRDALLQLVARLRLPAIYPFRYFAANGGLMSYGFDQVEQWRGAAGYIDRILRGARPGDLPIQAPTKYDFVVNLKTAKALGLTISPSLLATAVEVLE